MEDIEAAKNLTVKVQTAYSVWDVCRLLVNLIAPDVDIDIESKRMSDQLLFPGYIVKPMESLTSGRPIGVDPGSQSAPNTLDSSTEVTMPASEIVKSRFDILGNSMLSSQAASEAALQLMLQNNTLLSDRKQLRSSIATIMKSLPNEAKKTAMEIVMKTVDCAELLVPPVPTNEEVMNLLSVVTELLTLVEPDRRAALMQDLPIPKSLRGVFNSVNTLVVQQHLRQGKDSEDRSVEVSSTNQVNEVPSKRTRSKDANARQTYKAATEGARGTPAKSRGAAKRGRGRKPRKSLRTA
ncbi:uncharacterized protein DI49_5678 (plasmid) [Saccharomyces eubayanus]|uniref:uncharacterized protein n=1 Tax=Saccharomyces eubayanus TaxID=1080349 RepID=UPI0006C17E5D|nr:hypothetical protein DI49_5678 [Saccharomyces eubayanus]KOG96038.1 hypothetical protein DI49_5678 [Saccharomyces eubayanus]